MRQFFDVFGKFDVVLHIYIQEFCLFLIKIPKKAKNWLKSARKRHISDDFDFFLYFYAKTSRIQRILDVFIKFDVIFAYIVKILVYSSIYVHILDKHAANIVELDIVLVHHGTLF